MRSNILNYINKLQSYKTAIKNLHWSSKKMSEHKLLDDIADSVADNQDEIAEIAQGIFGKIKNNELKPKRYKIVDSKKMLDDMLRDTQAFYATINGKNLTGLRSVVENFIGELNKFKYLIVMCIKEDFKRNFKEKQLNENNYQSRYHKMMAAKHAAGKSTEDARNEISDYFAKTSAIGDINKDRNVLNMSDHEKSFNNQINSRTYDIDFNDLNTYDSSDFNPGFSTNYDTLDTFEEGKIRLSENELRELIRESVINVLKKKVNEVRYIDTSNRFKKDPYQVLNQEPIKNGESIRVYHGCDLKTALNTAINGLSGQIRVPRTYSYENGMNPKGLFVSTDFKKAMYFAYDTDTMVIMEFTVNSNDLDTPVWNDSFGYFGQGSNPQPFSSRSERDKQKQAYQDVARNSEDSYVRDSDNPAMAERIFNNVEHQALFVGNLNPNQIKRFWVKKNGSAESYVPLSRKQFLKIYGNKEFVLNHYRPNEKSKIERDNNYPYLPNEDFISFEDMAKKELDLFYKDKPKLRARYNDEQYLKKIQDTANNYRNYYNDALNSGNYDNLRHFSSMLYPKQLRQLFGDKLYNEVYKDDIM